MNLAKNNKGFYGLERGSRPAEPGYREAARNP